MKKCHNTFKKIFSSHLICLEAVIKLMTFCLFNGTTHINNPKQKHESKRREILFSDFNRRSDRKLRRLGKNRTFVRFNSFLCMPPTLTTLRLNTHYSRVSGVYRVVENQHQQLRWLRRGECMAVDDGMVDGR